MTSNGWVQAMRPRRTGTVNVEALRQLLPLMHMIADAKGEPRPTLSELINRTRKASNDGDLHRLLANARRKAEADEAALKTDWYNPPSTWQPPPPTAPRGRTIIDMHLPGDKPTEPEPPKPPAAERPKPNQIRRPRGTSYSYLHWGDDG